MTLKELRKTINDSEDSEYLNEIEVDIDYSHLNYSHKLVGLSDIYSFVLNQVKGWNSHEDLNYILLHSKNHFEEIKYKIEYLINNLNNRNLTSDIREIKHFLERNSVSNTAIFIHDCPEAAFLTKLTNKLSHDEITGAYDYIIGKNINTNIKYNYFNGLLKAYEFKNQDLEILQRRHAEKISLGKIRQQFQEHITEAELQLNEYLKDTKENLINHIEENDKLKKENNHTYQEWYNSIIKKFDDFYAESAKKILDKENLYREKLKLEEPAKYWKNRAEELKKEGNKWSKYLFIAVSMGATSLFFLLWLIPDGMFLKLFKGEASAIKWTIVYITFISFIAYSIKILAKLTFSTYHLSRDSEEREQLSYFYLALKKDSEISDEERQLILQSLFSRSDTGLLKEDSSPTMPSSIIEKHLR